VLDDADGCVCAFCAAASAVLLHVLFLHAALASSLKRSLYFDWLLLL
jgi:hypothetical protein